MAQYYFVIPLVVFVILMVVALVIYFNNDQASPPFMFWLFFFIAIAGIIISIIVHATSHIQTVLPAGQFYYYRPDLDIEAAAVPYPRYAGPLVGVKC